MHTCRHVTVWHHALRASRQHCMCCSVSALPFLSHPSTVISIVSCIFQRLRSCVYLSCCCCAHARRSYSREQHVCVCEAAHLASKSSVERQRERERKRDMERQSLSPLSMTTTFIPLYSSHVLLQSFILSLPSLTYLHGQERRSLHQCHCIFSLSFSPIPYSLFTVSFAILSLSLSAFLPSFLAFALLPY